MRRLSLLLVVVILFTVVVHVSAQDHYFPEPDLTNPAAPFIFTWHYAVEQGATAEWRKQEGVIIDQANKKLYMAVTRMRDGMSDGEGDIRLDENPCGMIMVGDLSVDWDVTELRPLIIGGPYDEATETCSVDNISEPDNIFVDSKGDLWIYEDTDLHANNFAWKYVQATGELLRFASLPYGSEGTGLRIVNDQVFLNVQHPDAGNPEPFNMATVGYVSNFKATDSFTAVAVPEPESDAAKTLLLAAGEYQVLGRAGDTISGSTVAFGTMTTISGAPFAYEGSNICNDPDGNMFIPSNEAMTAGILYTNWECAPGGVSRIDITQGADGKWIVNSGYHVDFGPVKGVIYNCNASVTPWGTGLTSEEDAPLDADTWMEEYAEGLNAIVEGIANPYDYGYITELIPNADGTTTVKKHYAMGRRENEQSWVAPDQRTVYFGDDGTDKIFYKFIATNPGDLSAGTLYAAHITQTGTNGSNDFAFTLKWIELGTSDDATVQAAVRALDSGA
ncbi:MAG: DUF839 domain-containing protein [Anaerolineae bacterium]|nr:DUF839 domain-containing protein [Anaerolineae bacterium]